MDRWRGVCAGLASLAIFAPISASAQDPDLATQIGDVAKHLDWIWTCIAAFLVFFMQAGFSFVESGMTRAKNAVNIMMKNASDLAIGAIGFWAIGFGLMFSGDVYEFFVNPDVNAYGEEANWMYSFLIFQTVFAATAATIVSGAVAERMKLFSFLAFAVVMTGFIYPMDGSWTWGGNPVFGM